MGKFRIVQTRAACAKVKTDLYHIFIGVSILECGPRHEGNLVPLLPVLNWCKFLSLYIATSLSKVGQ